MSAFAARAAATTVGAVWAPLLKQAAAAISAAQAQAERRSAILRAAAHP